MTRSPYLAPLDLGAPVLPEHLGFWAHCKQQELRFQRCHACNAWQHPPAPVCSHCGSDRHRWERVSLQAQLFSYTVVHHAPSPQLREAVPYNIAIVSFEGLGDARLVSNVVDAQPHEMRIGMPLRLIWQEQAPGQWLPLFSKHT